MPTHLSDDFKLAIVKQVTNGTSIYSLSKQFQISSRSIRRWIDKYQQTHSVSREKREVEAYKVYDVHVKYAITYLRKHPTTATGGEKSPVKQGSKPKLSHTPKLSRGCEASTLKVQNPQLGAF